MIENNKMHSKVSLHQSTEQTQSLFSKTYLDIFMFVNLPVYSVQKVLDSTLVTACSTLQSRTQSEPLAGSGNEG